MCIYIYIPIKVNMNESPEVVVYLALPPSYSSFRSLVQFPTKEISASPSCTVMLVLGGLGIPLVVVSLADWALTPRKEKGTEVIIISDI